MRTSILRTLGWLSRWRPFCALVALIFVVRGVFFLSVLPPFEGWDEYQHLGYIAYLVENEDPPVLLKSHVPRSLYPAVVRYPHAPFAIDQLRTIGAVSYLDYWNRTDPPTVAPDAPSIKLYQAQHAPLYYRLAGPVFRRLWDPEDPLPLINALRLMNVLFGGAGVYLAARVLGRLLVPGPHRYIIALLVALQPLLMINCARLANDALAFFLGTVAVSILLHPRGRRPSLHALAAGAVMGLAVLAKSVNLALAPFVLCVLAPPTQWLRRSLRSSVLAVCLFAAAFGAVTFQQFRSNLRNYGLLTPMQEAIENHNQEKGLADFARAAVGYNWIRKISRQYASAILFEGGWSYLKPPRMFYDAHQAVVTLSVVGWCFAIGRKRRRTWIFADRGTAGRLLVLCAGLMLGLAYHTLHGLVAIGGKYTNIWYAAVSFPWLICLYYQGIACLPGRWPAWVISAATAVIFVGAEIYGTLVVMVPSFTGTTWGPTARERLARLHVPGLGPEWTAAALGAAVLLSAIAMAIWVRALRAAPPASPR